MRATEFLTELYEPESSFPLNWYPSFDPSEATARAYDRNRGYIDIKFTPIGISKGMDAVEVEFSRNDSYDMTGGGDANRVLGTVLQAFREYLKGYQPKIIVFSAKGESRSKVYQNLIKRFAPTVGYKQFDISKLSPNTQAAIRMNAGGDVMVLRKDYNNKQDNLTESFPGKNRSKIYSLLVNTVDSGPFDGGCVIFARALQMKHGGDIVVLTANGSADHAALYLHGMLIDADGPAEPKQFIKRFMKNEYTSYSNKMVDGIRPIENSDLPDAPRSEELSQQIEKLL